MAKPTQNTSSEKDIEYLAGQLKAMQRRIDIEEALERVRLEALHMEQSDDIATVTAYLFDELQALGMSALRCAIAIVGDEEKNSEIWTTTQTADGTVLNTSNRVSILETPERKAIFQAWKRQDTCYTFDLHGEDLINYLKPVYPELNIDKFSEEFPAHQFISVFMFKQGGLFAVSREPLGAEEKWVTERFARVFELAYTRFIDLQKAEIRIQDALLEAALHRIRVEIASMRKSKDLESVTPMIWQELHTLNVPFFRCGFLSSSPIQTM